MTNKPQSTTEPPDRIWLLRNDDASIDDCWQMSTITGSDDIEYARVTRHYFCSCGAACTAGEYLVHLFELDHDRVINVKPRISPASTAPVVSDESGWLLEKMHNGNVHYIAADYMLRWTDDPNKALRLARREDAEALTTIVEDCEKIAEHGWPAAATAAPVEQCAKCGHLNELNENGICQHVKIAASNTDGPTLICGCDCLTASACLRCGHSTIDHHGECRQCIDWQRHKCTFAETTQRCQHCNEQVHRFYGWVHTASNLAICQSPDGLFRAAPANKEAR